VLGGLIGVGEYRKKYGYWSGEEHGYQLTAPWQAAIGQASTIGCFMLVIEPMSGLGAHESGIFLAGWAQDRWGYRRTLQLGLVSLACFIFIVFFSPNIYVLFIGQVCVSSFVRDESSWQLLCGLPWGAFSSVCLGNSHFWEC
jgi:SP family general alpha glucoside:H+ symporter-like MFS transporter